MVTDTVAGSHSNTDTQSVQSTISRFACRIKCQRTPPYTARIYAAGFDSSKNIFLGVRVGFQEPPRHICCTLSPSVCFLVPPGEGGQVEDV